MRRVNTCHSIRGLVTAIVFLLATPVFAQYVGQVKKQAKETPDLRAVAVLEWTGEAGKPKQCRLVPVSIFDGERLNDATLYLSRPEPIAVAGEVEYQLKQNGATIGLFDIKNAGQEQGSWVGYGEWRAAEKPKEPALALKAAPIDDPDADDDKPVLHRKKHNDEQSKSAGDPKPSSSQSSVQDDPDRPKLHKQDDSASKAPSDDDSDTDRPTLGRHSGTDSSSASAPDSDRLTIKKGKKGKPPEDVGHVTNLPQSTDPDRPRLQRGKSNADNLKVVPSLLGLPPDMEQAVAVSDPRNRPDHPWTFSWSNPGDEQKMKGQLEDIARQALGLGQPTAAPAPAPRPAARRTGTARKPAPPAPSQAEPAPLRNEKFRVFELSYGAGATMVLTAETGGDLAHEKFVTLIAQPDLYGNVQVLLKNVTDGAHLDETPHMRLVDAVDALADNRGELLFELRGQTQRQFALYRVLRGRADKIFASGGSEYGSITD